jgi:hypothetical protein
LQVVAVTHLNLSHRHVYSVKVPQAMSTKEEPPPASHAYLDGEHQTFNTKAISTHASAVNLLPIIALPGVVLFPSTTIPIRLVRPSILGLVDQLLSTKETRSPLAGSIHLRSAWENVAHIIRGTRTVGIINAQCQVGCVVELLSIGHDTEGWYCLGKGISRFQLLQVSSTHPPLSRIRHIQDQLPSPITSHRTTFNTVRCGKRTRYLQLSRWPRFVWNMFDPTIVSTRLLASLKQSGLELNVPPPLLQQPLALSFWCCDNLPFDVETRQLLMEQPTYLLRVQMLLDFLKPNDQGGIGLGCLKCVQCATTIAKPSDAFALSDTNIIGTFVNPSGCVMQVGTFSTATNTTCLGDSVMEHSWFDGYGWSMCVCRQCGCHLGWQFDSSTETPASFFGFRQECLKQSSTRQNDVVLGVRNREEYEYKEGNEEGWEEGGGVGAGEGEGEEEEGNQRRERHGLSASLLRSWWLAARSRLIRTTTEDDDITPLGSEIRLTVENPYADDRSRSGEE